MKLTVKPPPSQKDIWTLIATKHVPAVAKIRSNSKAIKIAVSRKVAAIVSREARKFLPPHLQPILPPNNTANSNAKTENTTTIAKDQNANPNTAGGVNAVTQSNSIPLFGGKRGMREMLAFWKKYEKEEKDKLKRAEKEKMEKVKEEEERREARRQARKLNFLIEQTEIFSHFVGQRLDKTSQRNYRSIKL